MRRNHRSLIVYVHCILFCIGTSAAAEIYFIKENIDVTVRSVDTVVVQGEYFFLSGRSDAFESSVFYPFPVDSIHRFPFFISVVDRKHGTSLPFVRHEAGVSFPVPLNPEDTTVIVVNYSQRVTRPRARYILMTTAAWGRPLCDSRYSVTVPKDMILSFVSYECDSVVERGGLLSYEFFKTDFMPDRDLSFMWTTVKDQGELLKKKFRLHQR